MPSVEHMGKESRPGRRILMVNHEFGGLLMSGIRSRRVARGLAARGYKVTVLSVPQTGSMTTIPSGIDIVTARTLDLTAWYRRINSLVRGAKKTEDATWYRPKIGFTTWINRWIMIPDKLVTWHPPAVRAGRRLLQSENFDLIYSTQPPRTNHLVARRLSKDFGIPCVLEFRDLWTGTPYREHQPPTLVHDRLHRALERSCLRQASGLITLSRGIAEYLMQRYDGLLKTPPSCHYNFFDPAEYPAALVDSPGTGARPFVLSHVGSLYFSRTPDVLFEGIRRFISRTGLTPEQWIFRWVGAGFGLGDVDRQIREMGIEHHVRREGQVSHREALRMLQDSTFSLIIQAPNDPIHVPSKIFESLGARVPVLAISHPCELTEIMDRTQAGLVAPSDPDAVASALEHMWAHHRSGSPWRFNETAREEFHMDHAIDLLANYFDSVVRAHT